MDFVDKNRGGVNDVRGGHVWSETDGSIKHYFADTRRAAIDKAIRKVKPNEIN